MGDAEFRHKLQEFRWTEDKRKLGKSEDLESEKGGG
jgi:hypothetical protein